MTKRSLSSECGKLGKHCSILRIRISFAPSSPSPSQPPRTPRCMSWWSRLLGDKSDGDLKPKRLDYLSEALTLERQGDYDAALTSYRLALRDSPNEPKIHMNM